MTPIDFLKNILTDVYKDKTVMKTDALKVYTLLLQGNQEPEVLTFTFSGQVFSIPRGHYKEALKLYQAGLKINAIKTIRCNGWMDSDKTATPDLKWAKDFVESFPKSNG
jgi:hypothetical protein